MVKARLQRVAVRLGVGDWKELERLLTGRGIDKPEVDLLWLVYLYLKRRLEEEKRKRMLAILGG